MLANIAIAASAQESPSSVFVSRMDSLMDGHLDALAVDELGTFQAVQFDLEGWQGFNDREMKDMPDGRVALERFRPIVREDVVSVNDNHWVILLHEKQGFKIHLATISFDGIPLQGFLLHDHYGYLYEKTHRAYASMSPSISIWTNTLLNSTNSPTAMSASQA